MATGYIYLNVMPTGYIYLAVYADRSKIDKLCEKIVFFKSSNANRNIHKIFCFMQFLQRTKWRLEKQHYKLLKHVQT